MDGLEVRPPEDTPAPMAAGPPYLYDVFISYRLIDPDLTVGAALQRALEAFRTPRSLVRAGVPRRLSRVFRDRSELAASSDLKAELVEALRRSRFLVVVCSKRTPESKWIAREVELFRELGGAQRILLLLLDGKSAESYPPSLVRGPAGEGPLAADIRAPSLRQSLRRLRTTEKLRLLAPILGVRFDDLWRRERRRRRQRLIAAGALAVTVTATVSALAWLTRIQARSRRMTAAIATLSDSALRLSDEGRTGLAAQLALQAHRFDPDGRLGMQSRVYAALRRALGSGQFNQTVSLSDATPNSVAVSGRDRMLAIGRSDGSIELLGLSPGATTVATTRFPAVSIKAVAFLPDDRRLAVGGDDGEVWIVGIEGSELRPSSLGGCGTVETLAVSPSGRLIAAGTEGEGVCLLDPQRPNAATWRAVEGTVRALGFSPNGKWLAAGRKGGIDLWAVDGDAVSARSAALSLGGETVTAVAFSGRHLAVGSHADLGTRITDAFRRRDFSGTDLVPKGVLRIWRIDELARTVRAVPADEQRVVALAFSRDGNVLASGGIDGTIRLWGVPEAAEPVRELLGHEGSVLSLAFDDGGDTLISAGADRSVRAWWLASPTDSVIATEGAPLSLAFLGTGHLAAAVKLEQTPLIWDILKMPPVLRRTAEVPGITTSVAADGSKPDRFAFGTGMLIGSTPDTTVRVWDLAEGLFPAEPRVAHQSDVDALVFSATGHWLASAGYLDKAVKLLDMQTRQAREVKLPDSTGTIHAIAFHPQADPPVIAVGGDGLFVVVDVASEKQTPVTHAFDETRPAWPVADLDFSADGAVLATTAPDGKIRLWRVGEWSRPHSVLEPAWTEGPVPARQLAINRVSGELAVGHQNGEVRVWTPGEPGRRPLLVNRATGRAIQSLAYDPSGVLLAIGSAGGGIEILSTLQSLVGRGCAGLFRNLSEPEWTTFVGPGLAYMKACPDLPVPARPGP